jgi:hypothetical protein
MGLLAGTQVSISNHYSGVLADLCCYLRYYRYYSLEVVQHPLRARMCGFGDKVGLHITIDGVSK